jgi:hypothetical protein
MTVSVKVKVILEQSTEAQRASRYIALLFLYRQRNEMTMPILISCVTFEISKIRNKASRIQRKTYPRGYFSTQNFGFCLSVSVHHFAMHLSPSPIILAIDFFMTFVANYL